MVVVDTAPRSRRPSSSPAACSSSVAILYLWPIVSASLLLPPWAAVRHRRRLQRSLRRHLGAADGAVGPFVNDSTIPPPVLPDNWTAQTVGIRVAAFLLIALLTGILAQALDQEQRAASRGEAARRGPARTHARRQRAAARRSKRPARCSCAITTSTGSCPTRSTKLCEPDAHRQRLRPGRTTTPRATTWLATPVGRVTPSSSNASRRSASSGCIAVGLPHAGRRSTTAAQSAHVLKVIEKDGFHDLVARAADRQGPAPRPAVPAHQVWRGRARHTSSTALGLAVEPARRRPAQHPVQRGARPEERRAHPPRPAQERLHGHHEPRAAHAADLGDRLQRHAAQRRDRRAQREADELRRAASSRTASRCSTSSTTCST